MKIRRRYLSIAAIISLIGIFALYGAMAEKGILFAQDGKAKKPDIKKVEKELIDTGKEYYRQRKYEEAAATWDRALELDPENKNIRRYLNEVHAKLKRSAATTPVVPVPQAAAAAAESETEPAVTETVSRPVAEGAEAVQAPVSLSADTSGVLAEPHEEAPLPPVAESSTPDVSPAAPAPVVTPPPPPASGKTVFFFGPKKREHPAPAQPVKEAVTKRETQKTWNIFPFFAKKKGPGTVSASATAPAAPTGPKIWTLDECIDAAIKNHTPLKIAERNVKLGEMRVFEAKRGFLPTMNVKLEESAGTVGERGYTGKKRIMDGEQPVFHGGEIYYVFKQAEKNLEITKEERNKIKNEVILKVKKGYWTLGKAKEALRMQTELKKDVDRIYEMVAKGHEAGAVSKLELLNVASQQNQAAFQYESAKGDVLVADIIMKQAMYVDPDDAVEIAPELEFRRIAMNRREAVNVGLKNRPEMKINRLMIEYYDYEAKIGGARFLPKVDLMGSWGLAKEEYTSIDNQPKADGSTDPDRKLAQQWYAGFKASMPFWGSSAEYSYTREQWTPVVSAYQGTEAQTNTVKIGVLDSMKFYSGKEQAEIDHDRSREELFKMTQDVTLEIEEGIFSYVKSVLQLETARSKLKYQERDLDLTKFKRGLDEVPDSNVIESMIRLSQERFGYVQALVDAHIAIATVNKAMGVPDYFKDEPPETTDTGAPGDGSPAASVKDAGERK